MIFELEPLAGVERISEACWQSSTGAVGFLLRPASPVLPRGWGVLSTRLQRRGGDLQSALIVRSTGGSGVSVTIPLSVIRNGEVTELVHIPSGTDEIILQAMGSSGEVEIGTVTFEAVGPVGRMARMLARVLHAFWRSGSTGWERSGLTFRRAMGRLPEAYRIAGQVRSYGAALAYAEWIARCDLVSEFDRREIRRHIHGFRGFPRFLVLVVSGRGEREPVAQSLDSLDAQLYRNFSVIVFDAGGALGPVYGVEETLAHPGIGSRVVPASRLRPVLNELAETLETDGLASYVLILPAGDRLAEHGLYWLAAVAQAQTDAVMIYADDDAVIDGTRCAPRFKPDWSPEHLRSTDYIGRSVAVRSAELLRAGGLSVEACFGAGHHLLLRLAEEVAPGGVVHIPAVLFHRVPVAAAAGGVCDAAGEERVAAQLTDQGVSAQVSQTLPGCYRIRYALPDSIPTISIIVPTRDKSELLRRCLESVLRRSTYPSIEILVVDNRGEEPATLAYLASLSQFDHVRVLRYDKPFSFSAINNFAAAQARGEVLCLLNNDTEVISPDWLEEMVGRLVQPGIGVVGAKLLFADGRVQHAGDAVGPGGTADHMHPFIMRDNPGYCCRAAVAQEVSAVTGACLVTWKRLYEQLGGLDEAHFPVSFNDVDYCLRVQESGLRVIWTPYAELYHHESATRGDDEAPAKRKRAKAEAAAFRQRWRARMQHDPYYNPNLNYRRPDFSLGAVCRVVRPWEQR